MILDPGSMLPKAKNTAGQGLAPGALHEEQAGDPTPEHSTAEPRFITIGMTSAQRLLVVAHTDRAERVRIISARPATRAETKKYEEGQESSR
jgi:uncharacterized DUF497 family protein